MVPLKHIARQLCPPIVWKLLSNARTPSSSRERTSHSGRYRTYADASRDLPVDNWEHLPSESPGESTGAITTPSTVIAWNEHLLALACAQALGNRPIHVVDFGGAFGGHLGTFRKIAPDVPYRWTVIEIPTIVMAGRKRIPPGIELSYETAIEDAPSNADLLIASGVLQYLEAPYAMLERFAAARPKRLFIDRVPFVEAAEDFLTVQHVPGRYFADAKARDFPAWWFSRKKFMHELRIAFDVEWSSENGERTSVDGRQSVWEALMLRPTVSADNWRRSEQGAAGQAAEDTEVSEDSCQKVRTWKPFPHVGGEPNRGCMDSQFAWLHRCLIKVKPAGLTSAAPGRCLGKPCLQALSRRDASGP